METEVAPVRMRPLDGKASRGRRVIRRHRALPGGRAVLGGFLVAIAVVGLFAAYSGAASKGETRVLVAAHDIAVGDRLGATDVIAVSAKLPDQQRSQTFAAASQVTGRLVIGPVGKGEIVQAASVLGRDRTPPFRSVTVQVDAAQTKSIGEGDVVDVLMTTGSAEASRTELVATGVRVLRVGGAGQGLSGDPKPAVTFAVTSLDEVGKLVQAAHAGAVTLIRATGLPPERVPDTP